MIDQQQRQRLTDALLTDSSVNLAVIFGPLKDGRRSEFEINILLDSEHEDLKGVSRWTRALVDRLQLPIQVWPLSSSRPVAMLMREVLERGEVLKDYRGQWDQLRDEHDQIVSEAEQHEQWEQRCHQVVNDVVADDNNVRLVVDIDPFSGGPRFRNGLTLVLDCDDDSKEAIIAIHHRLNLSEFSFATFRLCEVRQVPYVLSHLARTGRVLKDLDGQWEQLQTQGRQLRRREQEQIATVRLARRWFGGGRGGVASMN